MKNIIKIETFITYIIGIITGIVLSILQGVHVIDIGWFWATFPFWILPAVDICLAIILFIALLLVEIIWDR